ncbi:MAG: phosphopantetheine-binding protein, partial [Deltaproteobacteria bacterium]
MLWQAGTPVQWAQLYSEEKRKRIPLPTYPFEREPYWLEFETKPEGDAAFSSDKQPFIDAGPVKEAGSAAAASIGQQLPRKEETHQDEIRNHVLDILARVWGCEPAKINKEASFLEQGFDSLSLTQVSSAISKELRVKVTFAQLMEELTTLNELARFIGQQLPQPIKAIGDNVTTYRNESISTGKKESGD